MFFNMFNLLEIGNNLLGNLFLEKLNNVNGRNAQNFQMNFLN